MSQQKRKNALQEHPILTAMADRALNDYSFQLLEWRFSEQAFQDPLMIDLAYLPLLPRDIYFSWDYPYPKALRGYLHGVEVFVDEALPPGVVELHSRYGEALETALL